MKRPPDPAATVWNQLSLSLEIRTVADFNELHHRLLLRVLRGEMGPGEAKQRLKTASEQVMLQMQHRENVQIGRLRRKEW